MPAPRDTTHQRWLGAGHSAQWNSDSCDTKVAKCADRLSTVRHAAGRSFRADEGYKGRGQTHERGAAGKEGSDDRGKVGSKSAVQRATPPLPHRRRREATVVFP